MGGAHALRIGHIYLVAAALEAIAIGSAFWLGQTAAEHALLSARYTARVAFLSFLLVVVTGPAARRWKSGIWIKLARRRRHLGLAFAALMAGHLMALMINITVYQPRPPSELVGGGVVYALIAALALTSTDAAQRRLGKWWKRLHQLGVAAVLITFCISYGGRLFEPRYMLTGLVLAPLAFAALAIRIGEMLPKRR